MRGAGTTRPHPSALRADTFSLKGRKKARTPEMTAYILRRLAATVPVLLIVAVLVFLMLRLTPGDPAAIIAGDSASAEQVALIRTRLGLDQPIVRQFFIWFGNI